MITIHYFASVREQLDRDQELIELPEGVTTVADLEQHLAQQDAQFARLASADTRLLVAVNQTVVGREHPVSDQDEVAFFPPMTGG